MKRLIIANILTLLSLIPQASNAAEICSQSFSEIQSVGISQDPQTSHQSSDPVLPLLTGLSRQSLDVRNFIAGLTKLANDPSFLSEEADGYKSAALAQATSLAAGILVKQGRNVELILLAQSQLPLLLKFQYFNDYLVGYPVLQTAIAAGNNVALEFLLNYAANPKKNMQGLNFNLLPATSPQIAQALIKNPKAQELLTKFGVKYDLSTYTHFRLTDSMTQMLNKVKSTRSPSDLLTAMRALFPEGSISAEVDTSNEKHVDGTDSVGIEYSSRFNLAVFDSARRGFWTSILGGMFTTQFSLFSSPDVPSAGTVSVESVEFDANAGFFKVLVKQDEYAMGYGRITRYQELELSFNSNKVLSGMIVRNGDSKLTKPLWNKQTVEFRNFYVTGSVYIVSEQFENTSDFDPNIELGIDLKELGLDDPTI